MKNPLTLIFALLLTNTLFAQTVKDMESQLNQAIDMVDNGEYDKARTIYEELISYADDHERRSDDIVEDIYFYAGEFYYLQGNLESSLLYYRRALELQWRYHKYRRASLKNTYGEICAIYGQMNQPDSIMALYERLKPHYIGYKYAFEMTNLAVKALYNAHDIKRALQLAHVTATEYDKYQEKAKRGFQYYYTNIGYIYNELGNGDSALHHYQRSIDTFAQVGIDSSQAYFEMVEHARNLAEQYGYSDRCVTLSRTLIKTYEKYDRTHEEQYGWERIKLAKYLYASRQYTAYEELALTNREWLGAHKPASSELWYSGYYQYGLALFNVGKYKASEDQLFSLINRMQEDGIPDTSLYYTSITQLSFAQEAQTKYDDVINNLNIVYDHYASMDDINLISTKLMILNSLENAYRSIGNEYYTALTLIDQARLQLRKHGRYSTEFLEFNHEFAKKIGKLGYCGDSDSLYLDCKEIGKQVYGSQSLDYYYLLLHIQIGQFGCDLYKASIKTGKGLLRDGIDSLNEHKVSRYVYEFIGRSYSERNKSKKAMKYYDMAIVDLLEHEVLDTAVLIEYTQLLHDEQYDQEKYKMALASAKSALELYQTSSIEDNNLYIDLMNDVVHDATMAGDTTLNTISIYRSMITTLSKENMTQDYRYGSALRGLVRDYYSLKQYDSAWYYLDRAYAFFGTEISADNPTEGIINRATLHHLDIYRRWLKDKIDPEAQYMVSDQLIPLPQQFHLKLKTCIYNNSVELPTDTMTTASLLGVSYYKSGNYLKALECYNFILEQSEPILYQGGDYVELLYHIMGQLSVKLDHFDQAEFHLMRALDLAYGDTSKHNLRAAEIKLDLADLYLAMGRYDEILPIVEELIDLLHDDDEDAVSRTWLTLIRYHAESRRYQEAITLFDRVKPTLDTTSMIAGEYHYHLGKMYEEMGVTRMADEEYGKALQIYKEHYPETHPVYSLVACEYAEHLIYQRRSLQAIPIYDQHLNNLEEKLGPHHSLYLEVLFEAAYANYTLANRDTAMAMMQHAQTIILEQVKSGFAISTEFQRNALIEKLEMGIDFFQQFYESNNENEIAEICMNNSLVFKSLLLSGQQALFDTLETSGDTGIIEKLNEYRKINDRISALVGLKLNDRYSTIDPLIRRSDSLEHMLVAHPVSREITEELFDKDWRQIQRALIPGEVAIDFIEYNYENRIHFPERMRLMAFVIRPDTDHLIAVPLTNSADIRKLVELRDKQHLYASRGAGVEYEEEDLVYDGPSLSTLIWDPIAPHLKGAKTLHISPSGILNFVSFAALTNQGEIPLCMTYDILTYQNLHTLTRKHDPVTPTDVLLVGGVEYGDAERNDTDANPSHLPWKYLPGTAREVDSIASVLGEEAIAVTGKDASESFFKSNLGKYRILHIATHGFYEAIVRTREQVYDEKVDIQSHYDQDMMTSGLLLAGCNQAWINGHRDSANEDGILHASEVSSLNLQNTEIVVMSACETGLGELSDREGVYGLQRSFKKAGVDQLMVSLWQVPDKETTEFMTYFYKQWKASGNETLAYQQTLRHMYQQYPDDAFRWAAFVLLK